MQWKNISRKLIGNKIFWLGFFFLVLSLVYLNQFTLNLQEPYITTDGGQRTGISLPYIQEMEPIEYVIDGKIFYYGFVSADMVHIIPDDELMSIRVNGHDVPLDGVDPAALKDFSSGFLFNLGRYLQNGPNEIEIRIKNQGGPSGLFFQNTRSDIKTLIAGYLLMISILVIFYLILSCFIKNKVFILILLGGFLIRVVYFLVTDFSTREHDVYAHLEYIDYIFKNWSLPPKNSGMVTYHPPLYYISAALIYKAGNLCGVNNNYILLRVLQFFSLLLSMGFLGCSLAIFKITASHLADFGNKGGQWISVPEDDEINKVEGKKDRYIALMFGLVTFWPSGIMHSARIGNDLMFYFLYAWGLLFLIKWYYDNTNRSLFTGFVLITLCFITKANALVLYGVAGIIFLMKFIKERDIKKYLIRAAILLVIFGAGFWITLGASYVEKMQGSKQHFIVNNRVDGETGLKNQLKNYLWFDLREFIKEPYMPPWGERRSREYFWNYLFKTALVGEFEFGTVLNHVLAVSFSYLFLGMLFLTMIGLIMNIRNICKEHIIILLNLILLTIAVLWLRYSIPIACSNDFRYILPVLISTGFFYGYTLFTFHRKGWIGFEIAGFILAILFMAASNLFIIRLII